MKKCIAGLAAIWLLIMAGCKKDLLHWQKTERLDTPATTDRFNKIFFTDDTTGFVIGGSRFERGVILQTTNGGRSWTYLSDAQADKSLFGITSAPSGTIYTISFDGRFLKSWDNGNNWSFSQLYYEPYKDLAFVNDHHGILIGGVSFNIGYLEHIDSNGNKLSDDNPDYELNDLEMIDGKTGYISGYGVVQKTTDSGYTWSVQDIRNDNFTAIHAYGADEAWTCGYNGSIFHTANGGTTWERMRNGNNITLPHYRLLDIAFTDPAHGFAVGEDGLVIYTDDGGTHWMEFDRFTDAALRCLWRNADGSLFVCGDDGSLYRIIP